MAKKKNKTVVITGVAGFIGFHLANTLLAHGWRVIGLDSMSDYYDPRIKRRRLKILNTNANFVFHKLDITNYDRLLTCLQKEQPDEIVHLAAQAGVRFSLSNPWTYIKNNEIGTLNVFEAAHQLKQPRVVYASSSSVYGGNTKSPMVESDRTDAPLAVYGATKKANEMLAHAYNHLYGTEMIGLRFFTVYGIWGRPDLALFKFTKNILAEKPIDVYNHGKMKRSFTHISDVVAGIEAALTRRPSGRNEIFNLGGAETVPLDRFIKLIEKESNKVAKQRMLPMQMGDVPATVADCRKAKKELGFVPNTSIEEGIAEFVTWFKENQTFLTSLKEPKQ